MLDQVGIQMILEEHYDPKFIEEETSEHHNIVRYEMKSEISKIYITIDWVMDWTETQIITKEIVLSIDSDATVGVICKLKNPVDKEEIFETMDKFFRDIARLEGRE